MAITTMDLLVAALPGQHFFCYRNPQAPKAAGTFLSTWITSGATLNYPATGATPTSGTGDIPTSATAGALALFSNPSGGNTLYLGRLSGNTSVNSTVTFYDRLWENSGLVGNILTSQTVNSLALTRPDALGANVELWLEVYTATGVTQTTVTATYTNQAGTASRTATCILNASATAEQMVPFNLQNGDTGVRSVQSLSLTPSTGTAGNFGLVLLRRICDVTFNSTYPIAYDTIGLGMPSINSGACLGLIYYSPLSSTPILQLGMDFIQG